MPRLSKADSEKRYAALQRGIEKHWPNGLTIRRQLHTQKELVDALQVLLDAYAETRQAWARYQKALGKRRRIEAEMDPLVKLILEGVDYLHSADPVVMADFERPLPRKKGPKTTRAKVQMVVRARETRRLRGTMGPRQRKKLKGR